MPSLPPQDDTPRPPTPDGDGFCQLALVKRGQRYIFRYRPGEEPKMLASLVEMARDPASDLDWYDAAMLSHQMGQKLSAQLQRLLKP
jgi:hypothetical protein